jgi:Repeat of unknown function (DUF5907)
MGARLNREDVQLGAIVAGVWVTNTSTETRVTPPPTGMTGTQVDWGVLPSGGAANSGYVLTVNADGSIGWSASSGGGGTPGGSSGQIQYDNGGSFGGFTMSGDATLVTSTGVITIGAGAVTVSKMANLAASSLLGNPTGSAAAPSAITLAGILSFSGTTLTTSSNPTFANPQVSGILSVNSIASTSTNNVTLYASATTASIVVTGQASQTGKLLQFQCVDASSNRKPTGIIDSTMPTTTEASYTGTLSLYAQDYAAARLGIQLSANGSALLIGHYGVTPVVQPVGGGGNTSMTANTGTAVLAGSTFTGASGSSTYTIGDIVTALKALGLLTA